MPDVAYDTPFVSRMGLRDADGRRAVKSTGAAIYNECDPSNTTGGTVYYLYDQFGHAAVYTANGVNRCKDEIYAGSRHLATVESGKVFIHTDWLGTDRVHISYPYANNRAYDQHCTSLPFGDGASDCVATPYTSPLFFTGKERDPESGLDNFGARFDASSMGRFMSPDPTNQGVDFYYPQTWNRYAYALDNPQSIVDNNGLWPTRIHESIINKAFPGLSDSQRQNLKTASKDVDRDQSEEGAYKHGMSNGSDPNGSVNALQDSENFIDKNVHDAEAIQAKWLAEGNTGIAPAAMTAFGNALHTITDETSPAHEGFQPWYGVFSIEAIIHVAREQYISPARMNQATNAAQSAFRRTFGDRLYWMAIGQPPPLREQVTVKMLDCSQTPKPSECS